jgi:non-specific serine/threonine protein kinase
MADSTCFTRVELVVGSHGHIYLDAQDMAEGNLATSDYEKIKPFFDRAGAAGVLYLGILEFTCPLPPSFFFWQTFAKRFITRFCRHSQVSDLEQTVDLSVPDEKDLLEMIPLVPFMKGAEYITVDLLRDVWREVHKCLQEDLSRFLGTIEAFFQHYNPSWNVVGRVCLHLAENKNSEDHPFAFLATYVTKLSSNQVPQHLPLNRALQEYVGEQNKTTLLALLLPLQKAASQSPFIKRLVDSGAIFQAQAWTASEAYSFLKDIPILEQCGIKVAVPNWWNPQKPPRPKLSVTVGSEQKSLLGLGALLDFRIDLALSNGEKLSPEEWQEILNSSGSLIKIKGQWIEVDQEKLSFVTSQWKNLQKIVETNGLSMSEALRLLAGASSLGKEALTQASEENIREWTEFHTGEWLSQVLDQLRTSDARDTEKIRAVLNNHFCGTLRPYQLSGVSWLYLLYQLKLGGCLADDMGLGKTIQVLALLLLIQQQTPSCIQKPHLLVVPASLIGNWKNEVARFAPSLSIRVVHGSAQMGCQPPLDEKTHVDLFITTYGQLFRTKRLQDMAWDCIILDEAQNIKNPGTKQTHAVKSLHGEVRIVLTGTPIENRLSDLWSLFDFTSPGLLGTSKVFSSYAKNGCNAHFIQTIRTLTGPYILRRRKSDKTIISDLPDKTETEAYCSMTKDQVQAYQQVVTQLAEKIRTLDGMQRRGLVLSTLIQLKQICNHPSQWMGYGGYSEPASGKFIRIRELCEEIASRQEKVLVFTQFREIIPALSSHLETIFNRGGLFLHGGTSVQKRPELVAQFQQEDGPPFFILSLKAGGCGLNLTAASHVIHFDRWWNPAVENQATDRAYRIGQTEPVMVHKFVCTGTVEEKIDELIRSKKKLSSELLDAESEISLTELSDEELLHIISLDIHRVREGYNEKDFL